MRRLIISVLTTAVALMSLAHADPGGLPECRTVRDACQASLTACSASLDACEGDTSACEEQVGILQGQIDALEQALLDCQANQGLPGDGVTGTAHSYSDTGNTLLDNVTGLEWAKKNNDASSPHHANLFLTFAQAQGWIADLNAATYEGGGWRLPRVGDLVSVLEYTGLPAIPGVFGIAPTSAADVWTSTPGLLFGGARMTVDIYTGRVNEVFPTNARRVFAVR